MCTRGSDRALCGGPSTSPLGAHDSGIKRSLRIGTFSWLEFALKCGLVNCDVAALVNWFYDAHRTVAVRKRVPDIESCRSWVLLIFTRPRHRAYRTIRTWRDGRVSVGAIEAASDRILQRSVH